MREEQPVPEEVKSGGEGSPKPDGQRGTADPQPDGSKARQQKTAPRDRAIRPRRNR